MSMRASLASSSEMVGTLTERRGKGGGEGRRGEVDEDRYWQWLWYQQLTWAVCLMCGVEEQLPQHR